ncbi:MAG: hypothetical protein US96_C0030G0014 [Candidatus Woesebacteria bacterium GW2011_GWB1_38_5b]|uniref:DinB-like domain-containing protein n=1 Tax=Candidatus Woesebacteria bacterium GW2011_GWB1_38_5b TaxID=1618569 RepID=A0A0G0MLC7_9BACT|nr:MAG: hypothetical protein US96_C0030G0014 [Candidatus Woesebacteria bacterium GW2011_GWB1_38_5b]
MDISKITNTEANKFATSFFQDRAINREYYKRVPEGKFDFRMVDTPEKKSDSPRDSLGHQIGVQHDYMNGVTSGTLSFESGDDKQLKKLSKYELLKRLQEADEKLIEILSDPDIGIKKVKVPWSDTPIPAIASLWAMDSHEILHTGWNLAVMDHLNMERFDSLKRIWG